MKKIFDDVSAECSKITTRAYSSSFSLGIYFLKRKLHRPIYAIYGFVRFADEIVDSFQGYDKYELLMQFRKETFEAIDGKISLNPILNSFQETVHQYKIDRNLVDTFLHSMEMDLGNIIYNRQNYEQYILGSAEVVGLMCLHVFTAETPELFDKLKPAAMSLGAAFQKINFLRDVKQDFEELGRSYFPGVNLTRLSVDEKRQIEREIGMDLMRGLEGIRQLPGSSKRGVYLAYYYYLNLFRKIIKLPPQRIMMERIRISNTWKFFLIFKSYLRYQINLL